jgi:hypothetical protein
MGTVVFGIVTLGVVVSGIVTLGVVVFGIVTLGVVVLVPPPLIGGTTTGGQGTVVLVEFVVLVTGTVTFAGGIRTQVLFCKP